MKVSSPPRKQPAKSLDNFIRELSYASATAAVCSSAVAHAQESDITLDEILKNIQGNYDRIKDGRLTVREVVMRPGLTERKRLMSNNPYDPPSKASSRLLDTRTADGALLMGVCFIMVLPAVFLWDQAVRLAPQMVPQPLRGDIVFDLVLTLVMFAASAAAIPLGIVGFRSTRWRVALLVLLMGASEAALIYFIKLHPWIVREFGLP